MPTAADIVVYNFSTTDWELISSPPDRSVIKNPGGHAVVIVPTDTADAPVDIDEHVVVTIGGATGQYVGPEEDSYLWARCTSPTGYVRVLPYGITDPESDISQLATAINNAETAINEHKADVSNPHAVTKAQVGLGTLPNAKNDDPTVNDSEVLATTKATNTIVTNLNAHKADVSNPHAVTKAQVGLGNVSNFLVATVDQAYDKTRNDLYMTPLTTYESIVRFGEIASSIPPQRVIAGKTISRITGWNYTECSPPTQLIDKMEFAHLQVHYKEFVKSIL